MQTKVIGYIAINYEDPGVFIKCKTESEIIKHDLLDSVDQGIVDVFRLEMASYGPQLRKMLVNTVENEDEGEATLEIADWELVLG